MRTTPAVHSGVPRADPLDDWVGAGLIAPDQAVRIRAYEVSRPGRRRREIAEPVPAGPTGTSLVVEGLGYVGGVIMLVGAGILVGLVWEDIPVVLRLVLGAATAVSLIVAGLAVPDRLGAAAGRLRSVLWVLGVAATATFFTLLAMDVLDRYDEHALLVTFPPTALVAAVLWWTRRTWLQQLALLVSLVLSASAVGLEVAESDSAPGIAVWILALAWVVVAWTGRIQPRATGLAFGGVAAVFGALTIGSELGIVLGLATAVAILALALYERSLPLLAVAALGLLQAAPRAAFEWFPGRLSASLTLITVGGLLVGAAVWVARHRGTKEARD